MKFSFFKKLIKYIFISFTLLELIQLKSTFAAALTDQAHRCGWGDGGLTELLRYLKPHSSFLNVSSVVNELSGLSIHLWQFRYWVGSYLRLIPDSPPHQVVLLIQNGTPSILDLERELWRGRISWGSEPMWDACNPFIKLYIWYDFKELCWRMGMSFCSVPSSKCSN